MLSSLQREVVRISLAGIDWTAEAIFSKNLNDVYYKNLAYEETGATVGQKLGMPWDNRPAFQSISSKLKSNPKLMRRL